MRFPIIARVFGHSETKAEHIEQKSLASPEDWLLELFGAIPAASGVAVTATNAMTCTAVRCAVQAIAEAIGQLPVHVYERSGDAKERAPDHPAYRVLHDEASEWVSASEFREQLTRDALLHGDGLAYINRVEGRPIELLRLDPTTITIEADRTTGEPVYRSNGPDKRAFPRANIFHLRAPSLDGIRGTSPVAQAREAIGVALTLEAHAARLFSRGARPSGVLSFPGKLGHEVATRIRASWQATHGGSESGRTAVLEEGGTFLPLTFNSVDSQFLELRKFAVEEIARAFRVPPVFLMDYGRATWSNSEEIGRQFVTFTLMPWLKRWEGEIRLKLFPREERKTFFAEFLVDDLLRADLATRMAAYSSAIAARVLNPNEARAAENRAPYAGGEQFINPNTSSGAAA